MGDVVDANSTIGFMARYNNIESFCDFGEDLYLMMSSPIDYIKMENREISFNDVFEQIEPIDVIEHINSCDSCNYDTDKLLDIQDSIDKAKDYDGRISDWYQDENLVTSDVSSDIFSD